MMDEATLQKSAEKLDGNLIVLPASIHDVYLMVEREGLDMERLRNGVYGANRAFPDADYLSDEIYRYDRIRTGCLSYRERAGRAGRNGAVSIVCFSENNFN